MSGCEVLCCQLGALTMTLGDAKKFYSVWCLFEKPREIKEDATILFV